MAGPRRDRLRRDAPPSWLRDERERRELLQGTLARQLGVSPQSLSLYENGKNRIPDDIALKIARLWDLREVDVRRNLGLYVPDEMAGAPVVAPPEWPENALRLPPGVDLSSLDPADAAALETIVDAFLDSVRRRSSGG